MRKKRLKQEKYSTLNYATINKNSNAGITLIALVVTIVVLLLLARDKYNDGNWK